MCPCLDEVGGFDVGGAAELEVLDRAKTEVHW